MSRFSLASEKRGGTYAHNSKDEQNAEGNGESVDNENVDKENREHNTQH